MDLGVAITLMIGCSFMGILGLKVAKTYFATENTKSKSDSDYKTNSTIQELEVKLIRSQNGHSQTKHKLRKIRDGYDLDYDDVDYDESEDEEFRLSELAQSIYPKLPPSLAKLIDKEEFQNAIVKTVEKKPDIINTFVDKFLGSKSEEDTPTTNKLHETYL